MVVCASAILASGVTMRYRYRYPVVQLVRRQSGTVGYSDKKACSDTHTYAHTYIMPMKPARLHTQAQRAFPFCFVLAFAVGKGGERCISIGMHCMQSLSLTHTCTHSVLFVVFAHAVRQRSYSASRATTQRHRSRFVVKHFVARSSLSLPLTLSLPPLSRSLCLSLLASLAHFFLLFLQ